MSSWMNFRNFKHFAILTLCFLTLVIISFAIWILLLDHDIQTRIADGWFLPPVEIYSAPQTLRIDEKISLEGLTQSLERDGYLRREIGHPLRDDQNNFALWDFDDCQSSVGQALPPNVAKCLVIHKEPRRFGPDREDRYHLVTTDEQGQILALYSGQPFQPVDVVRLEPRLFAQFYDGQPILRRLVPAGQVPLSCLQAITAIEDSRFLEHQGVSFIGLGRAFLRNLREGRVAEGGSTITQQLVKNYFLTSERSLRRKFKEMFMAFLLELRHSKEEILENYLNVIYMGQNGPFQIRGYGAASEHYFFKSVSDLDLPSCALLAAIVNSPGRYNPFTQPELAQQRRNLVLNRMMDLQMIDPGQGEAAKNSPLPSRPPKVLSEPAPYFVQAVNRTLEDLKVDLGSGLRVYTTLDVDAQEAAQRSVREGLAQLEKENKGINKLYSQGKRLEASFISVDVETGGITALVGGRGFKETQYNRALVAHRQVGSIMKPFVFLAALETLTPDGRPYQPLTPIEDKVFVHRYEGQKWSPKNYDKKYRGSVPMFFALKNSLNAATARLAIDVGLQSVVDVAARAGVQSKIDPLPSLSLGAFELYPLEVAKAYTTIARMGSQTDLFFVQSVEDFSGQRLFEHESLSHQAFAQDTTAVLIGMLKETIASGTGMSISTWRGFHHPAAGKTGTTSDTKDAWFAGFTPYVLAVTWVGYDDNTPNGLTGSSGAVPIWTSFMKAYGTKFPPKDFSWPENSTTLYTLPKEQLNSMVIEPQEDDLKDRDSALVFRAGEEPRF